MKMFPVPIPCIINDCIECKKIRQYFVKIYYNLRFLVKLC